MVKTQKAQLEKVVKSLNNCGIEISIYKDILYPYEDPTFYKEVTKYIHAQINFKRFINATINQIDKNN